jgi:hypothetical protein
MFWTLELRDANFQWNLSEEFPFWLFVHTVIEHFGGRSDISDHLQNFIFKCESFFMFSKRVLWMKINLTGGRRRNIHIHLLEIWPVLSFRWQHIETVLAYVWANIFYLNESTRTGCYCWIFWGLIWSHFFDISADAPSRQTLQLLSVFILLFDFINVCRLNC